MHTLKKSKYYKILTKEFLIKEYIKNKKPINQISREVKYAHLTVKHYLNYYKINLRKYNGKLNCQYKHGKSTYKHYCIDCKKKIRWRSIRCIKCSIKARTLNKVYYCKYCKINKIDRHTASKGKGNCRCCANKITMKKSWSNFKFRQKRTKLLLKSLTSSPNKVEKFLKRLFRQILPNEYKFVGNGKVIIDGFCPDFINCNGQKKIIEFYGDYWHKRKNVIERDKRRIKSYKKYGYKTLIIWEHELKDLEMVTARVLEFSNVKSNL